MIMGTLHTSYDDVQNDFSNIEPCCRSMYGGYKENKIQTYNKLLINNLI